MTRQTQEFVVSRAGEKAFADQGLRSFFRYRDLGISEATGGAFGAHVIRANEAVTVPQGAHRHSLAFQMVYVLSGQVTFWYEGQGEVTLQRGDSVLQPPRILHEIRACSSDAELLEITMPAAFETQEEAAE
jgi:uncharacterized RmlC-like cupin family protein